jgi:flagellar basal body-associated protein FliL
MKYFAIMYLTTFGEWVEGNILVIIALVVGWLISTLSTVATVSWFISGIAANTKSNGEKVEALAKQFEHHVNEMDDHRQDSNLHTTFEYRQSVNARFDKIERGMTDGHNRIENKIDRLIDRLIK